MLGYYGKLPAQGDFLRRRADVTFVMQWDAWLQRCLATSRATLGENWQEFYENAPIWRFCFGAKVCGPNPMIGVMMPSQDRVGRCFPLTVFARLESNAGPADLDVEPFMSALEDTALYMLADGQGKDALDQNLDQIDPPDLAYQTDGADQSHWLSTFFAGSPRRDSRQFTGLPQPAQFIDLLNPASEGADV